MKSRTIFILCTFVILFSINKYSLHKDIKLQNEDISIVNLSGKQRMYSQKITKLALIYGEKNTETLPKTIAELNSYIFEFSKNHKNLKINHLKKYNDFHLTNLFQKLDPYFNKTVMYVEELVGKKDTDLEYHISLINKNNDTFLSVMDNIVSRYEMIGKIRGERILNREFTFNIILIALSFYTVFFLLFPLINSKKDELSIK
jgi:hypothetical protein